MDRKVRHQLIAKAELPVEFDKIIVDWYTPLAKEIAATKRLTPLVIGVQGAQGSGKSTLASFLKHLLKEDFGLRAVDMSLDDFYLGHRERRLLAADIHPLLATRGVPGTHDVDLAIATIQKLRCQTKGQNTLIPRFDKAIDDRKLTSEWNSVSDAVDVIIFEGWCVGATAEPAAALAQATNELERNEDPQGLWRSYVNNALDNAYQRLFSLIDKLIVLKAPSFECVYQWRWLQEQKLIARWHSEKPDTPARFLDQQGIKRFISHYERITRHCLDTTDTQADWILTLNVLHDITGLKHRGD